MSSWTTLASSALILLVAACGDEARINVSAVLGPPLTVEMLEVKVRDGGRLIHWNGSDFTPRSGNATPSTEEAESTSGPDLELTYRLESAGIVISSGSVTLPRKSDWHWGVTIFSATANPEEGCFGCFGAQAFPLADAFRTPGQDSIWVVWGGNSIDDPAIY
jgi:hypothetical protein